MTTSPPIRRALLAQGRAPRAFTLIEMLLAAAGAALILGVLVNVYGQAVHLRNNSAAHTRSSRLEARAIRLLREDLRNAWLSGGKLAATLDVGDTTRQSRFPGDLRFDTTTGRIDEDTFSPELQEVEYYIADDPDSPDQKSGVLKRTVTRTLLATVPAPEGEETLLAGVEAMEVGFFDGNEWQPTWDVSSSGTNGAGASSASASTATTSSTAPAAPLAIRVRLTLTPNARPGMARRMIEVIAPWPTQVNAPPANITPPATPPGTNPPSTPSPSTGTGTGSGAGTGSGTGTGGAAK